MAAAVQRCPAREDRHNLTPLRCGLTSHATTRAKLTKRAEFGRYATTPFRTVLAQVEACCAEAE